MKLKGVRWVLKIQNFWADPYYEPLAWFMIIATLLKFLQGHF